MCRLTFIIFIKKFTQESFSLIIKLIINTFFLGINENEFLSMFYYSSSISKKHNQFNSGMKISKIIICFSNLYSGFYYFQSFINNISCFWTNNLNKINETLFKNFKFSLIISPLFINDFFLYKTPKFYFFLFSKLELYSPRDYI
jgi:hypothetical protein